jgi:2-C-methyl-D-erythritol 4-phosphate cytidylyltransferase/2-C-methyl-D-erythritol 2,4-cyclodiphosphate synthase
LGRLVVVIDPEDEALARDALGGLEVELAHGASSRTGSVRAGLAVLAQGVRPEAVLIHDAARPGLTPAICDRLIDVLADADGAAPALPSADALKRVSDGWVEADVARGDLRRVQTPQAFRFAPLWEAFQALPGDADFEDDIAVARAAALRVRLIEGDARLAKVTVPEDFAALEHALAPATPLIGTGFDAHRFGPGEFITLCGLRIPHTQGLIGHSDADAAWHALTDAILGAVGAGDIGEHFPPSDVRWKGAPSELFLRHALALATAANGRLVNVDMTIMCEAPKIKPHREAMRVRTAEVLSLPLARVSVKATTTEGLGFLGRREGLAAQASAMVLGRG